MVRLRFSVKVFYLGLSINLIFRLSQVPANKEYSHLHPGLQPDDGPADLFRPTPIWTFILYPSIPVGIRCTLPNYIGPMTYLLYLVSCLLSPESWFLPDDSLLSLFPHTIIPAISSCIMHPGSRFVLACCRDDLNRLPCIPVSLYPCILYPDSVTSLDPTIHD